MDAARVVVRGTLKSDGTLELSQPLALAPGPVEVTVKALESSLPPQTSERRSALEIIASLRGHRLFKSADEVDRHLQEERDSWQR